MANNRNNNRRNNPENITPQGISFTYSENFNRVVNLTTENYPSWRTNILYLLDINNLIDYINVEKIKKFKRININNDINDYIQDKMDRTLFYHKSTDPSDIKNDNITKWIIINTLGDETRKIIENNGKTAFEMWNILRASFTKSNEQIKLELKEKLEKAKYDINIDINIFISFLQNIFDELESLEYRIPDDTRVGILNRSLPDDLRFINVFQFKENWNMCIKYVTKVIPDILYSNKKEGKSIKQENNELMFVQTNKRNNNNKRYKNNRKNGRCFICRKYGHYANECKYNKNNRNKNYNKHIYKKFKLSTNKKPFSKKPRNSKYKPKHTESHALLASNDNKDNIYKEAFTKDFNSDPEIVSYYFESENNNNYNQHNTSSKIHTWIIDSGASVHITNDLELLINPINHVESITFANGDKIQSSHKGKFIGFINNNKLELEDVLYVPDSNKNLISISKLTHLNYKFIFSKFNNKSHMFIYSPNGKRITSITANHNTNTYELWITSNKINHQNKTQNTVLKCTTEYNDHLQIWHRRLAHFNIKNIINKLPNINTNNKCKICSKSKLRNKPFHPTETKTTHPFQLIHMDLVGPITESLYGNKYILTILDDFTRFNWVYFIKNKSDTYNSFKIWYNMIKNVHHANLKNIRTDNGLEFININFKNFCNEHGIIHQTTIPYNPQQNGRAERLNGILINSATALLEDAKLSRKFWQDAVETASYIYNRVPHQSINNNIPYEKLTNNSINYNNIKVFGCRVLFLIPKQKRHKLENTASPGIFIGYCNNPTAFKIFDINNKRVIYSRVVEFYENEPANFYFNNQINNTNQNEAINYYKYLSTNHLYNQNVNINNQNQNQNNNNHSTSQQTTNQNYHQYLLVNNNIKTQNNNTDNSSNNNLNLYILNTKPLKRHNPTKIEINEPHYKKPKFNKQNPLLYNEPYDYNDIFNYPDKNEWLRAIKTELENMRKLKVYTIVKKIPSNANIVTSRWIFKYKRNSEGNVVQRKARLVARGFTQQLGIDYKETFSPTLKQDSLRIITAIASQMNFSIKQLDINAAYLNADLSETIYLMPPEGYQTNETVFWKLNKALYGLKQSGKEWNEKLNNVLTKIGFNRLTSDPCVYKKINNENHITCILAVYVDDILLTGVNNEINKTKSQIKKYFQIKDIGEADFIIGIKYQKYNGGYFLHQKRYINDLLCKYKSENIKPTKSIKPIINEDLRKIKVNLTKYKSIIGNLRDPPQAT